MRLPHGGIISLLACEPTKYRFRLELAPNLLQEAGTIPEGELKSPPKTLDGVFKASSKSSDHNQSGPPPGKRFKGEGSRFYRPVSGTSVVLPNGWSVVGEQCSVIRKEFGTLPRHGKIAAFDFDGCLAKTKLGGYDPTAWTPMFGNTFDILQKLHRQDYSVVIITNEVCCSCSVQEHDKGKIVSTDRIEMFACISAFLSSRLRT